MKYLRAAVLMLLTSLIAIYGWAAPESAGSGWASLFDGKTLSGWKTNTRPDSFSIVDGTVRARATGESSHLEPDNAQRTANRVGRRINPNGGTIALQGHDPKSTFYFKDIRIRRL